jgi:hypothetical protein
MTDDKSITLPPLPPHRLGERWPHHVVWRYEDMVTFARAAVLLDRQQRPGPHHLVDALQDRAHPAEVLTPSTRSRAVMTMPAPSAEPTDHTALLRQALDALNDMNNGWQYIRASHGDLYGVGWDRAENKASAAIDALRKALEEK